MKRDTLLYWDMENIDISKEKLNKILASVEKKQNTIIPKIYLAENRYKPSCRLCVDEKIVNLGSCILRLCKEDVDQEILSDIQKEITNEIDSIVIVSNDNGFHAKEILDKAKKKNINVYFAISTMPKKILQSGYKIIHLNQNKKKPLQVENYDLNQKMHDFISAMQNGYGLSEERKIKFSKLFEYLNTSASQSEKDNCVEAANKRMTEKGYAENAKFANNLINAFSVLDINPKLKRSILKALNQPTSNGLKVYLTQTMHDFVNTVKNGHSLSEERKAKFNEFFKYLSTYASQSDKDICFSIANKKGTKNADLTDDEFDEFVSNLEKMFSIITIKAYFKKQFKSRLLQASR